MSGDEDVKNSNVTGQKIGLLDLPPEKLEEVLKHLATSNPNETARDFNSFRRVSKGADEFVRETPALGRFVKRVADLGEQAKAIYDSAVPKHELLQEIAEQPGDAYSQVAVAAPVAGFRPKHEVKELVAKVSDLPNRWGVRDEATAPLIASKHVDQNDKIDLIDDSIKSYNRNREGYSWASNDDLREAALYIIKDADERGLLTNRQKSKLSADTLERSKPKLWDTGIASELTGSGDGHYHSNTAVKEKQNENDLDKDINRTKIEAKEIIDKLPPLPSDVHLMDDQINRDNQTRTLGYYELKVVSDKVESNYDRARELMLKGDSQQIHSQPESQDRSQIVRNERSRERTHHGL